MWLLLREELTRVLPELRALQARLAAGSDAAALALWQRRLAVFGDAARVLGIPEFDDSLDALRGAWARVAERDSVGHAQITLRGLDELATLASADAPTSLAALRLVAQQLQDSATRESTPTRAAKAPHDSRLLALFATEMDDKTAAMDRVLLRLEQHPDQLDLIAPLMRAAHSIKGAARAVGNDAAVTLAHALEDRLSAAQKRAAPLDAGLLDAALQAADALRKLGGAATDATRAQAQAACAALAASALSAPGMLAANADVTDSPPPTTALGAENTHQENRAPSYFEIEDADSIVRVRASHLGRLIGLAGTGTVESRRLPTFAERQQRMRGQVTQAGAALDDLHQSLGAPSNRSVLGQQLSQLRLQLGDIRHQMGDWIDDFGEYTRDAYQLSERLYHAASASRLRPLQDIAGGYPRMVRDVARQLDKRAHLVIVGGQVAVDRDVLERLDAPLTHLLRNAVDHGIESPALREAAGKAREGVITLSASHRAGMLAIEVADDGNGVDYAAIRQRLTASRQLSVEESTALDRETLAESLFAAGFTTRDEVSEISGRGVGLDVVREMVKSVGGSVRIESTAGRGTRFALLVPISRAVTRALVVRIGSERYAFPLARVDRVLRAESGEIGSSGGLPYLSQGGRNLGLIDLGEHLGLTGVADATAHVDVVVASLEGHSIGFTTEAILGEYDLATRALDARLGRVADLAGLAVLPDGAPVVLLDVDDLMRGALEQQRTRQSALRPGLAATARRRRILVVDDSISVRELERQMLLARGYEVEVAIDGADAWAKLREWPCDLVVTDVDMPRMDGIELTRSIKQDPRLRELPVVIVSYRDRDEDRTRGVEVRADAYLTKSDFHEETFARVIHDLIGDETEAPGA
ncbi:MAG: response regulator [Lysobacterales bacterium]